ncbi:MAG: YtcA family lipoprotein [Acetobacter sp.]
MLPVLCLLNGCSLNVAPSFPIVGAYFPAWMFCSLVGIAVAIGLRVVCVYNGIDSFLSFRLFTYVSLGVLAALAVWLVVFGP